MKKTLIFALAASIVLFTSCLMNPFHNYPAPDFSKYDWEEISKEEAQELWKNYPAGKIADKVTVYIDYPGCTYTYPNTKVRYHDPEGYYVMTSANYTDLNVKLDYEDKDVKIYQSNVDNDLVKIEGLHNWYDSIVYRKGWLVEARKDTADNSDHEYYFVKY